MVAKGWNNIDPDRQWEKLTYLHQNNNESPEDVHEVVVVSLDVLLFMMRFNSPLRRVWLAAGMLTSVLRLSTL